MHILVIEDDPDVADVVRLALSREGHHLTCVADGDAGVAAVLALPLDLVISDVSHPGATAAGICACLREHRGHVPFVLNTGWARHEVEPRWLLAACDAYLRKPWRLEQLLETARDLLDRGRRPQDP